MAATVPWLTSNSLIASVQRKISFPTSQATFSMDDVLAFANEEMMIAQVPSMLDYHQEYFVTYEAVQLQSNLSKYPIPDRAIGMRLRDLFWQDDSGNLFETTRIDSHDRAFFQASVGANQAIYKFYLEGNDIVLDPGVAQAPTGSLIFVFFLRPNQLVKDDKAATITGFNQNIKINSSLMNPLDNLFIGSDVFTAVASLGGTISLITPYSSISTLITCAGHNLVDTQNVTISGSDSNPSVDGTYKITVVDENTFTIPIQIGVSGTSGTFTSSNQFLIAGTNSATTSNIVSAINSTDSVSSAVIDGINSDVVTLTYDDIYTNISAINTLGFVINLTLIGIQFNSLPTTYTDLETNITTSLFTPGALVDFLQTKPGHKTYKYNVTIPANGISGTTIYLPSSDLLVPTGSVNNSVTQQAGSSFQTAVQYVVANLQIGDYICLQNECIIPQIPPDLHNGLAERTSARILASLGDQAGLNASNQKISEIETRQATLLNQRSEGTPQKVSGRHGMLAWGKRATTRRY